MSHNVRQVIRIERDATTPNPSFTFVAPATLIEAWVFLFSEGAPGLEAKWTFVREDETEVHNCTLSDSFQNVQVASLHEQEVPVGTRIDFSVNDPQTVCVFAFIAESTQHLLEPVVEPQPEKTADSEEEEENPEPPPVEDLPSSPDSFSS